ncbi:MAG: hypothetical protein D6737_00395 [Chloroflexi bacterium]|nr:MAG: hypothetical protein D6737_00395 [Chloroflexota bacterium]
MKRIFWIGTVVILAGCNFQSTPEALPTQIESVEALATSEFLRENAPPEGFETVAYPRIDETLNDLQGWRYLVTLEFNGTFSNTAQETTASARAEVWFNRTSAARRVVLETSGELIGREENEQYEAVRLGADAFLVRDDVCLSNATDDARLAADLRAGDLVGGVNHAVPTGQRATLNGEEAWEYRFEQVNVNMPAIRLADGGVMTIESGELWVAPEHNVPVRFYINLDVENAIIFDRQSPVTGLVLLRYDLFDIGQQANINVPFGC